MKLIIIHYEKNGALCNQKGNISTSTNKNMVTCKKCLNLLNKKLFKKPIYLITGRKYDYDYLIDSIANCLRKNGMFNQSLNFMYESQQKENDYELFEIFEKYVELK
jgi:reverse gyrase